MKKRVLSTLLVSSLGWGWSALGAPITSSNRDVLTPNTGAMPLAGVTLGGTNFRVLGLQGVRGAVASSFCPTAVTTQARCTPTMPPA
jgi:hypothetical protein